MMSFNQTETNLIVAVLQHEHASDPIKANALLRAFEEIFVNRCKFAVAGQLATIGNEIIDPRDPRALKVILGWYSTQGEADKAAGALWKGANETWRAWSLPVSHVSAAEFHGERKQALIDQELKAAEKRSQRFRDDIERRQAEAAAIAESLRSEA